MATIEFNADNWTGRTEKARINKSKKAFSVLGYDFRYTTKVEDYADIGVKVETVEVQGLDSLGNPEEYRVWKVVKTTYADSPRLSDKEYNVFDGDIHRSDADPIVAACKLFCNIL